MLFDTKKFNHKVHKAIAIQFLQRESSLNTIFDRNQIILFLPDWLQNTTIKKLKKYVFGIQFALKNHV